MKILFVTNPYPNYVPDLLLHGLRKLLGPDVIDYPRKDCLYQGILGLGLCTEDLRCPGWFPDDNGLIDREDIGQKVAAGYFKYIVCDFRAIPWLFEHLNFGVARLIVIDGEDRPVKMPPGNYVICRRETDGSDFSVPLPMALPEEILQWITAYDSSPKEYTVGFLGSINGGPRKMIVDTISGAYPDSLLQTTVLPSLANPSPQSRVSRDEYYQNLQKCRIVLSLSGAGHDTFRFWENAACNAVHLAYRFPLYIPRDFIDGQHLLRFGSLDELERKIDYILEDKNRASEIIKHGQNHLREHHLTTKRAGYFLDKIEGAFQV